MTALKFVDERIFCEVYPGLVGIFSQGTENQLKVGTGSSCQRHGTLERAVLVVASYYSSSEGMVIIGSMPEELYMDEAGTWIHLYTFCQRMAGGLDQI